MPTGCIDKIGILQFDLSVVLDKNSKVLHAINCKSKRRENFETYYVRDWTCICNRVL